MTFDEKINSLNPQRRKIVMTFHTLKAAEPQSKKYVLIKRVAKLHGYSLDKKNGSNSYVMKVIREWGVL